MSTADEGEDKIYGTPIHSTALQFVKFEALHAHHELCALLRFICGT